VLDSQPQWVVVQLLLQLHLHLRVVVVQLLLQLHLHLRVVVVQRLVVVVQRLVVVQLLPLIPPLLLRPTCQGLLSITKEAH
jgi:hypothetical protein